MKIRSKTKAELLKEFEPNRQEREEALSELSHRTLQADESAQTFTYKPIVLIKFAYLFFVRGHCSSSNS